MSNDIIYIYNYYNLLAYYANAILLCHVGEGPVFLYVISFYVIIFTTVFLFSGIPDSLEMKCPVTTTSVITTDLDCDDSPTKEGEEIMEVEDEEEERSAKRLKLQENDDEQGNGNYSDKQTDDIDEVRIVYVYVHTPHIVSENRNHHEITLCNYNLRVRYNISLCVFSCNSVFLKLSNKMTLWSYVDNYC